MKTGVDCIRERLIARNKKLNLANAARDCGTSPQAIDAFMEGRTVPPVPILSALVNYLWNGHAIYNAEQNALESAYKEEPKPFATVIPPRYVPDPDRLWRAGATVGAQPKTPPKPQARKRDGWIGRF